MEQKTKSSIKRKRVTRSGKEKKEKDKPAEKYPGLCDIIEDKMQKDNEKGRAMVLEKYPDILEKIKEKMKTEKLHPWVKEFAGIVNTGKTKM